MQVGSHSARTRHCTRGQALFTAPCVYTACVLLQVCMPAIISFAMCVPVMGLVSLAYVSRFIFFVCSACCWYAYA